MASTAGKTGADDHDIVPIVKKAARGDAASFSRLYDVYLEPIYRYVYYRVGEYSTAEDITQEVFIKAWKGIKGCRGKEKSFRAWLYRIAHNHTIDYFRNRRDESRIDERNVADETNTIDANLKEIEKDDEISRVIAEMASLPDSQRQVVVLKFLEGLGNSEVSKIMGKSQGAVRILQVRALAALRKRILGYGRTYEQ